MKILGKQEKLNVKELLEVHFLRRAILNYNWAFIFYFADKRRPIALVGFHLTL
jgi:hypothetical protein